MRALWAKVERSFAVGLLLVMGTQATLTRYQFSLWAEESRSRTIYQAGMQARLNDDLTRGPWLDCDCRWRWGKRP